MKKFLCLFSALSIVLMSSCSSDDSPSNSSDLVLLKKQVLTHSEGKLTINYKYDGNKIVSAIDDSGEVNLFYTYTGDQITQIDFKLPNGTVEQVNTFTYSADGKLSTFLRVENETVNGTTVKVGYKEVYTYNANGTISVKSYTGNSTSQSASSGTSTITLVNGDVSEIVSTNSPNHKYAYDTQNNPAKNILGMDKIAIVDGEGNGVFHNEISDTVNGKLGDTHTYSYNAAGYPQTSVDREDGETHTSEYFY
ncbi:hypothetical protein [Flavobacterium sp. MDT1-60]|uniref:hypothetical protein n=1 Tax=Flavobacterium sp. MDT1-60 TaxID=1979344 RepID=UPI00177D0D9E|nr:hypothetical protein [Flavobacterium sp. MDT1-60]QOG02272.1 hypothetical protein IHE43_21220 [Flavobacterium sp. MDT1-60]